MPRLRDVRELGKKTIDQAERMADFYYQMDNRTEELMPKLLRQIILYTQLLEQVRETIPGFMEHYPTWGKILQQLTDAYSTGDKVLTADILHHALVPAIENWVAIS